MSGNDDMFNGGGTPLNNLNLKKQPQQMPPRPQVQTRQPQPPQMYPPQDNSQMPPQQMPPQMSPQQMHQMYQRQPQQMYTSNQKLMKQGDVYMDKVKSWCGDLWKETILVIVIFIILNNSFSYGLQNKFIPYSFRFEGSPAIINVILSALVAGIVFFLVTKFVIQK